MVRDSYRDQIAKMYRLTGEPVDVSGAADLAASDSIGSMWAIGPVSPRPAEGKNGADQGMDSQAGPVDCSADDEGRRY
jgi:hypothetical protein